MRSGRTASTGGSRGKWWELDNDEVEEALINYIKQEHDEDIPPKNEVDVSVEFRSDTVHIRVTGKERE